VQVGRPRRRAHHRRRPADAPPPPDDAHPHGGAARRRSGGRRCRRFGYGLASRIGSFGLPTERTAFCVRFTPRGVVRRGAERTDAAGEISLDISGLGSVYLGGFSFGDLVRASRAEELVDGAVERADALFRTAAAPGAPRSSE
jgi:hypothetical protein